MQKEKKAGAEINFLSLFKKSIALSMTALIFGIQPSYADIVAGGGYNTNVSTDGNVTNITGGLINGDTGFHHFTEFGVDRNNIANLIFSNGANRYVNLVDGRVTINGIFNAYKDGAIGGNVIFVSPLGMIVGASGIVNVGSLQTITPANEQYQNLIGLGSRISYGDITALRSDSNSSSTTINGKIFAADSIDINDGRNVIIGANADIVSGFNENGFAKTTAADFQMSDIVNDSGIIDSQYMSESSNGIKIVASNINSTGNNGLIQSAGDISMDMNAVGSVTIGSQVVAGGDVNIGQNSSSATEAVSNININNNITAGGDVNLTSLSSINQAEGTQLNANSLNASSLEMTVNGNITTRNGITLNPGNLGSTFTQGDNSVIRNTDSGNIQIRASRSETNSIINSAEGGNIELTGSFNLKDTIKTEHGNISVNALGDVVQADDSFNAFESAGNFDLSADNVVGTDDQSLNVDVSGNVNISGNGTSDIYLASKDSDLNITSVSDANNLNIDASKAVNVSRDITAYNSVNINAQEGFNQADSSTIYNTGAGGVNITNSGSGDVQISNIDSQGGAVNVENNASDGKLNISGEIYSDSDIDLSAQNGIEQSDGSSITLEGSSSNNITISNAGNGDVNLKDVSNTEGNINISNQTGSGSAPTPGNINLGGVINSDSGNISIAADGNISQTTDGTSVQAGGNIDLDAGQNIGSDGNTVIVSSGGTVSADAQTGGVHLTGENTDIELGNINAGTDIEIVTTGDGDIVFNSDLTNIQGDLKLSTDKDMNIDSQIGAIGEIVLSSTGGDIILNSVVTSVNEGITLNAQGGILQSESFNDTALVANGDINLNAQTGDVGSVSSAVQMQTNGSVTVEGGNVYLQSPGNLNIAGINASKENPDYVVSVTTTNSSAGNINFSGLVKGSDVSINSAQGITQDEGIKSVEASGNLNFVASNGSVGQTGNAINFSADSVSASASESVVLTGVDTDIRTSNIHANENIDLSTTVTQPESDRGHIIVEDNLSTENGYIRLNSAKNLEINNNISAGREVTLQANGGIVQQSGTSVTSGTANAGVGTGTITISNEGTGDIVLTDVTSTNGDILVTNNAADADVVLNSVLNSTDSNIVITSAGDIVQGEGNSSASLIAAEDITLDAVNAGSLENRLIVNANNALNGHVDNMYVTDSEGGLALGEIVATGDVYLTADGNITQVNNTTDSITAGNSVNLVSESGNIGGNSPDEALWISGAGRVNAEASNIYLGSHKGLTTGRLTAQNDINVNNTSAEAGLNIDDDITANGNITLSSSHGIEHRSGVIQRTGDTAGDITISSTNSGISLGTVTNENGNVNIDSTGRIAGVVLNDVVTSRGGDININAQGDISQTQQDAVSLVSDGDINLTSNDYNIGTGDYAINFRLEDNENGQITANAGTGSVYLKGDNSDIKTSNITANGDIDLTTEGTGDILIEGDLTTTGGYIRLSTDNAIHLEHKLTASDYIELRAYGSITQDSALGVALEAGTDIRFDALYNNVGAVGNEINLIAGGNVSAINVTDIYFKSDSHALNVGYITATGDVGITTTNSGDITLNALVEGNNITMNAADGVYQNGTEKTIDADGALSLTAGTGSIGRTDNAINFSAASVTAQAERSVVLLGVDTDINTSNISANENIDLTTQVTDESSNKGTITVSNDLTTQNGYVKLDSAQDLVINNNISAGQHITLNANGGIVQGADNTITSGTAGTNNGDISISNAGEGDISLGSISANGGDVSVTNTAEDADIIINKLVDSSGSITMSALGDISQASSLSGLGLNARGGDVSLTAGGNLGSAENKIQLNAQNNLAAAGANVYLTSPDKTLNISNIDSTGVVDVSTQNAGDINLGGAVTGSDITLSAANGIYQTIEDQTITATGHINLIAQNNDIGTTDNAIKFSSQTVEAEALNGSIVLNGVNTDINTLNISAGRNIDLSTTESGTITVGERLETQNGYIRLDSADDLVLNHDVISSDYLYLGAADGLTLASQIQAQSDITMSATGGITQTAGSVVSQNGNINITNSTSGDIILSNVAAQTGAVDITNSAQNVILQGLVNANTNLTITSAGNVTQNYNGVALRAGNDITVNAAGDAGSSENALQVSAGNAVNADANNVYLRNPDGTLTIGTINADNEVELSALNNIVQRNSSSTGITAQGDVSLTSDAGSVGTSSSNAININTSGNVNADAQAGSVYLTSAENINTGVINAMDTVDVRTTGDNKNVVIKDSIRGNDVILDASGSVLQDSNLDKTIEAGNLYLTARGGSIGETGNAIDFTASNNLEATAAQAVVLNSVGRDLNTSSVTAGTSIDLSTEGSGKITVSSDLNAQGGYIRLDSAEDLELNRNLTASDYIELSSKGGDVTLLNSQITAGTYVDVDSSGAITQTNSLITAGTDIILNAVQNIGTAGSAIAVNAANDVRVNNAIDVYLESEDTLNIAGVNASGTVDLDATKAGDVNIKGEITGNDITIAAADNIYQSMEGQSVTASGDVSLSAQNGDIGQTGNAINLEAESVRADAASGSIVINGIDTDINTNDITAGRNIDLTTTGSGNINVQSDLNANGYIRLDSSNELNLEEYDITSSDYIYLGAGSGITLDSNIQAQTGVTVDSNAGIVQNSGYINSATGDISITNNGAGGINLNNVNAQGGSVIVNAAEGASGNILLDNILANNAITVNNNTSSQSNVNLGDLTATNGAIFVTNTSGGDVILDSVLNAQNNTITINAANGDISQSHTNPSMISGGDITLLAQNVGSDSQYINTQAGGNVNADGANIYIESNQDSFKIGNINSGSAYTNNTVNIKSNQGDVVLNGLVKGNAVDIDSARNVTQDSSLDKSVEADTITFNTQNGNIGSADNRIDMSVTGAVNVENADSVYLNGVDNGTDVALNLGNINASNTVDVTSETGMRLNGLIDTQNAILSAQGDILQNADVDLSIDADTIRLESANGDIGQTGNAIDFKTTDLQASAINGSVVLNGVDSSINTGTIEAGTNIDLSTTGSGDITIFEAIDVDGYIRLNAANSLNVNQNLTAQNYVELLAQNGDVILNALVTAIDGGITIDAGSHDIIQQTNTLALSAGSDIRLNAGTNIGSGTNSIILNSGGNVYLDGENIYIDSPDSDLNIAQITGESGTVNIKTSGASGSLTLNDDINAENITLSAINALNLNANAQAGQNGISLTGQSVNQAADTTISAQNGTVSISASNGDIDLQGSVDNENGNVVIVNSTTGNGNVTVNNVSAGTSYNITNSGNGLLTVKGELTSNNDSVISAENTGANSGLVIEDTAVINNNDGILDIRNSGQRGSVIAGEINNALSSDSVVQITNNNGLLNLSADIRNGDSAGALNEVSIINNGSGLTISGGVIDNYGTLHIENNGGETNLNGAINAYLGSTTEFIHGTDSDLHIGMQLENRGNTITIENSGTGSMYIDEGANLSVYSVNEGGQNYEGVLNLVNSSTSAAPVPGITIDGTINNGSASQTGGTVNIIANGQGVTINEGANINNYGQTNITNQNSANAQGSIIVNGSINGGSTGSININNEAQGSTNGIQFGSTADLNLGNNSLIVSNSGQSGIDFANGSNINSSGRIEITNNSGSLDINSGASVSTSSDVEIENNADFNADGSLHGGNVSIANNNGNVNIAHNTTEGNITADNNVSVTVTNGDILNHSNSETMIENGQGITAGGNLNLSADNIGTIDSSVDNILSDGFNLDSQNSINVSAGGKISATAQDNLNIHSYDSNLDFSSVNADNAIISTDRGNIFADNINAQDNLYLYAGSDSSAIDVDNVLAGTIFAEAGSDISLDSTGGMNIETMLSRNGSIDLVANGNSEIREIAAANNLNITVNDEKLTVINLGRVSRDESIIPHNINITVNDAKNTTGIKNGKLDIYNGYAQDKVTLKADTITAQVYDISEDAQKGDIRHDKYGNEATGFHNANQNGELLEFDIQGANTPQSDVGSNPHNPYYTPDADDKRAQNVYLTLGDSIGDAVFGAKFNKLYADYAFVDSISKNDPAAFSKLVMESGIIGQYAIFRNNNLRLDINNNGTPIDSVTGLPQTDFAMDKHYDDAPDEIITNPTSFYFDMYDTINITPPTIRPDLPPGIDGEPYNPNRQVKEPNLQQNIKSESSAIKEKGNNSAVDESASTGYRQIGWVVRDKNNEILGASDDATLHDPVVDALVAISQKGMVVTADTTGEEGLKNGQELRIDLKYKDVVFNVDGKVNSINGRNVEIAFVNVDKLTSTVMLFLAMFNENL